MAYIRIRLSELENTVAAIENYVADMHKNMSAAAGEVDILGSRWQGEDYAQFRVKWSSLTDDASVFTQMSNALRDYAGFLKYAEDRYKKAQIKALSSANTL